jgi:hypothetical protein
MAVMPRETWTDERLDDLAKRMDDGFRELREDQRAFRAEVNARFERVDDRFERVDDRFDALQRTILQVGAGLFGTIVIGFLGLIVTRL